MAYTAEQLEARITTLENAIARGERSVQFSDRSVTYKSMKELTEAVAYFRRQLVTLNGGRSKQRRLVASNGF